MVGNVEVGNDVTPYQPLIQPNLRRSSVNNVGNAYYAASANVNRLDVKLAALQRGHFFCFFKLGLEIFQSLAW